jgi:hypothetical protein
MNSYMSDITDTGDQGPSQPPQPQGMLPISAVTSALIEPWARDSEINNFKLKGFPPDMACFRPSFAWHEQPSQRKVLYIAIGRHKSFATLFPEIELAANTGLTRVLFRHRHVLFLRAATQELSKILVFAGLKRISKAAYGDRVGLAEKAGLCLLDLCSHVVGPVTRQRTVPPCLLRPQLKARGADVRLGSTSNLV